MGSHPTQCGLLACQVSSWSVHPFGHSARTSQTDRTDRQRTYSIGRTVLQTVAQKLEQKYLKQWPKLNQRYSNAQDVMQHKMTPQEVWHFVCSSTDADTRTYEHTKVVSQLHAQLAWLTILPPSRLGWHCFHCHILVCLWTGNAKTYVWIIVKFEE